MKKNYLIFTTISFALLIGLLFCLFTTESIIYVTMSSIFIPILIGAIFNFDLKAKTIFREYYEPLYQFIRTYHDVLGQPNEYIDINKKREMMGNIAKDMKDFVYKNLKYSSDEVFEILEFLLFVQYESSGKNDYQNVYDINRLVPVLMKEIIENYNVIYFNHYLKRKFYMKREIPHKVNYLTYLYCDGFIIDIARRKEYVLTIDSTIKIYKYIQEYRFKHYKEYNRLYNFCKKNMNTDVSIRMKKLKKDFNIDIKKIMRNKL